MSVPRSSFRRLTTPGLASSGENIASLFISRLQESLKHAGTQFRGEYGDAFQPFVKAVQRAGTLSGFELPVDLALRESAVRRRVEHSEFVLFWTAVLQVVGDRTPAGKVLDRTIDDLNAAANRTHWDDSGEVVFAVHQGILTQLRRLAKPDDTGKYWVARLAKFRIPVSASPNAFAMALLAWEELLYALEQAIADREREKGGALKPSTLRHTPPPKKWMEEVNAAVDHLKRPLVCGPEDDAARVVKAARQAADAALDKGRSRRDAIMERLALLRIKAGADADLGIDDEADVLWARAALLRSRSVSAASSREASPSRARAGSGLAVDDPDPVQDAGAGGAGSAASSTSSDAGAGSVRISDYGELDAEEAAEVNLLRAELVKLRADALAANRAMMELGKLRSRVLRQMADYAKGEEEREQRSHFGIAREARTYAGDMIEEGDVRLIHLSPAKRAKIFLARIPRDWRSWLFATNLPLNSNTAIAAAADFFRQDSGLSIPEASAKGKKPADSPNPPPKKNPQGAPQKTGAHGAGSGDGARRFRPAGAKGGQGGGGFIKPAGQGQARPPHRTPFRKAGVNAVDGFDAGLADAAAAAEGSASVAEINVIEEDKEVEAKASDHPKDSGVASDGGQPPKKYATEAERQKAKRARRAARKLAAAESEVAAANTAPRKEVGGGRKEGKAEGDARVSARDAPAEEPVASVREQMRLARRSRMLNAVQEEDDASSRHEAVEEEKRVRNSLAGLIKLGGGLGTIPEEQSFAALSAFVHPSRAGEEELPSAVDVGAGVNDDRGDELEQKTASTRASQINLAPLSALTAHPLPLPGLVSDSEDSGDESPEEGAPSRGWQDGLRDIAGSSSETATAAEVLEQVERLFQGVASGSESGSSRTVRRRAARKRRRLRLRAEEEEAFGLRAFFELDQTRELEDLFPEAPQFSLNAFGDRVYKVRMLIGGVQCVGLLDCGAGISGAIRKDLFDRLPERLRSAKTASRTVLVSACTTSMQPEGRVSVPVAMPSPEGTSYLPETVVDGVEVMKRLSHAFILGISALEKLNIVCDFGARAVWQRVDGGELSVIPLYKRNHTKDTRDPITPAGSEPLTSLSQ